MRKLSPHTEWLSLVEVSGPFLTTSVLEKNFPQGLEVSDSHLKQRLRSAYDEWRDAVENNDPQLGELHLAWNQLVLRELFEFDDSVLFPIHEDDDLTFKSLDSDGRFVPDFALRSHAGEQPMLLICVLPENSDLEKVNIGDEWPVSIHERMVLLCRSKGIRFGLITNGEQWMLVDAPMGGTSSSVSWYAHLWFQEEVTLRAFQSLLGVRRWFGPEERSLAAMLDESLKHHEEVTDTLGEQVRRAVEVLVQSLDKADQDRNRELLQNVTPTELYEAGLTVMMRLVFLLCAEERGLLLLGDSVYDQYYAVSTLRAQLVEEAERHGHEVLERRHDGWGRLLAIFRIIYGGIEHETLRMPALGGSLFDPDRFSFLEGRVKGTSWKDTPAQPLPIDNRTVLLLLGALQALEQAGGALLLSYKALDVEQIGHVYEGLLEYTVLRMTKDTLGLVGSQKVKFPNITLLELESALIKGQDALVLKIKETTIRSESAIHNALKKKVDEDTFAKILLACGGDMALANRIRPFALLMRKDAWDDFIVYRAGSFAVTLGSDRRETGTHYTPKSLTESIVETTLEPIVYDGLEDGKSREGWQLKSSVELLDLKICDPAMGSGAFLVQVCRWLSERLVEAWCKEESKGKFISVDGDALNYAGDMESMPSSLDERLLIARRLIAEKCLYGVDLNPLAVELAKLSIWLITLAKGRPFGFLDHNLRSGDSLMGLHKLEQLTKFSLMPEKKHSLSLFASNIDSTVKEVIKLRKKLRQISIRDIRDVEYMERLDKESRRKLTHIEHIADAIIGEALVSGGNEKVLHTLMDNLSNLSGKYVNGDLEIGKQIVSKAKMSLSVELPENKSPRKPFHWVLEFPEVFERGGFDSVIGNPPYLGAPKISGTLGNLYREFLIDFLANKSRGLADLSAYFLLRVNSLLLNDATCGLIVTSTIAEGDTRIVGLQQLVSDGCNIIRANTHVPWPGTANVTYTAVWFSTFQWKGPFLINGKRVLGITPLLSEVQEVAGTPYQLSVNKSKSFNGVKVYGNGFVISPEEARTLIERNERNKAVLFPYITTKDVNSHPSHLASAWAIRFFDWPLNRESAPENYSGYVASDFPECLEIIEQRVKPERTRVNDKGEFVIRKPMPQLWWIYGEKRPGLYSAIAKLNHVLAVGTQATKYVAFAILNKEMVFSHSLSIIADDSLATFAILNSSIHEVWSRFYGGYNLALLRYSPTDLFETFPFPENLTLLEGIGRQYNELRQRLMLSYKKGLTEIYNKFHDPEEKSDDISEFRSLHIAMDIAVVSGYGWEKLELGHDFYKTKQGMRFTISEETRREVLQRLLKLNYERHREEIEHGLNNKKKNLNTPIEKGKSKKSSNKNLDLFEN